MTSLESKMYLALQGARTIVAATANVNPQALKIKKLVDDAIALYQDTQTRDRATAEESDDAA